MKVYEVELKQYQVNTDGSVNSNVIEVTNHYFDSDGKALAFTKIAELSIGYITHRTALKG